MIFMIKCYRSRICFNRYMVECECYKKYGYVNEDDPF